MAICKLCRGYTKYEGCLCTKCYTEQHYKRKETKNEPNSRYPSHTELYRDFHLIKNMFASDMYYGLNVFEGIDIDDVETDFLIEQDYWDIIISFYLPLTDSLRQKLEIGSEFDEFRVDMLIEYKSSINEWGKQIDQHFRQVKQRIKEREKEKNKLMREGIYCLSIPFLMSFDTAFEEYRDACKMARINLVVLPKKYFYILQGKTKEEREKRREELIDKEIEKAKREAFEELKKEKEKAKKKIYYCIDCDRKIKHKGKCLMCNMKAKKEREEKEKSFAGKLVNKLRGK